MGIYLRKIATNLVEIKANRMRKGPGFRGLFGVTHSRISALPGPWGPASGPMESRSGHPPQAAPEQARPT